MVSATLKMFTGAVKIVSSSSCKMLAAVV